MIVLVDPLLYYRICLSLLCESIDCKLYKNSQVTDFHNQNPTYSSVLGPKGKRACNCHTVLASSPGPSQLFNVRRACARGLRKFVCLSVCVSVCLFVTNLLTV